MSLCPALRVLESFKVMVFAFHLDETGRVYKDIHNEIEFPLDSIQKKTSDEVFANICNKVALLDIFISIANRTW